MLLVLIMLNIPLLMIVLAVGHRPAIVRRIELALSLLTSAALAWTVLDGPIFMATASDRTAKLLLLHIIAFTLIYLGVKLHRRVRPTPNQQLPAYQ